MNPPAFWQRDGFIPALLAPAAGLVAAATRRRVNRPGWRAPVPVLCCGNASVGGAGKTTVVIDLTRRLRRRGVAVHCLTRGYGGRVEGVLRVDPARHSAALVGDEPLLLAAEAPTWVGADRAASAHEAIASGAELLLMDDGLQNPGLIKSSSLLIVDGAVGFGNGRVMPAGPLRERVSDAAARCRACVLIGADTASARAAVGELPVLDAWLAPDRALDGERVFAFCGIARPGKFFETVAMAGGELAGSRRFPDHHPFSPQEMIHVMEAASRCRARPITTAKDAVRLPPEVRAQVEVLGVRLMWRDEAALERLLDEVVS